MTDFSGAKLIVFIGSKVLVIRRDNRPDIPWPGYLDFPGGGREGGETPEACVIRETREEVGLVIAETQLIWKNPQECKTGRSWFFAAQLPADAESQIIFGNEGTGWGLMSPARLMSRQDAIPHFKDQLQAFLARGLITSGP